LELIVEDQHEGRSDCAQSVGTSTLEEGSDTLFLEHPGEAVGGALVDPLFLGLLRLHLKTSADGVEGVGGIAGRDGGGLGASELGKDTQNSEIVLVRVHLAEGVVESEVDSAVGDDTSHGNSEAVVETKNSARTPGGFDEAVPETLEVALALADVRGQTGTGVVKRVDDAERASTGKTSRGHLDQEEHAELLLGVVAREKLLDGVLEGEVEGLGREVTDDVGKVATPEGPESLLPRDSGKAVHDTRVAGNLAGPDARVGILSLDQKFDTLDRGSHGLGYGTGHTSKGEVAEESHGGGESRNIL